MADLTPVLTDLAEGRIDVVTASERIDALRPPVVGEGAEVVAVAPGELATQAPGQPRRRKPVSRLAVRAVGRRVVVRPDESVQLVKVAGPHRVRRVGGVVEVVSDDGQGLDAKALFKVRSVGDLAGVGLPREVVVRVNPRLALDADLTGGTLTTEGVVRLGRVRVTAGSLRAEGVERAEDVLVQAGSLTLAGTFAVGRNRLAVESGTLRVALGEESDVTVHASARLGAVLSETGRVKPGDEIVLGDGSSRLDLAVVMGRARVLTPDALVDLDQGEWVEDEEEDEIIEELDLAEDEPTR